MEEAKPIVMVYTDGIEETGYEDIFGAVSRDDQHIVAGPPFHSCNGEGPIIFFSVYSRRCNA